LKNGQLRIGTHSTSPNSYRSRQVVGDVGLSLGVIGILALPDAFHFEVQEEAFRYGIISTITLAAHAANEVVLRQQILVKLAGVLAAPA
jgi:hypothetical protein